MPTKDKAKQAEYGRRHYEQNRDAIKARATEHGRRRRREIAAHLREVKEANPCIDCKVYYPWYVMQFDHVRGEKLFNIGGFWGISKAMVWATLLAEVEKCEVVCANCHAARTWSRKQDDAQEDDVEMAREPA